MDLVGIRCTSPPPPPPSPSSRSILTTFLLLFFPLKSITGASGRFYVPSETSWDGFYGLGRKRDVESDEDEETDLLSLFPFHSPLSIRTLARFDLGICTYTLRGCGVGSAGLVMREIGEGGGRRRKETFPRFYFAFDHVETSPLFRNYQARGAA